MMWNSFGADTTCLKRFLKRPGKKTLEIHLLNEVCQRNQNCAEYERFGNITPADYERGIVDADPIFRAEWLTYAAQAAQLILDNRKGLTCYISPGLESNLSPSAMEILIGWLKPLFPTCKFVWNGMQPGQPSNANIQELHGMDGAGRGGWCIWNNDGIDLDLAIRPGFFHLGSVPIERFAAAKSGCQKYYWISEFNGRVPGGTYDQPAPRDRANWPTGAMLAEIKPFLN